MVSLIIFKYPTKQQQQQNPTNNEGKTVKENNIKFCNKLYEKNERKT